MSLPDEFSRALHDSLGLRYECDALISAVDHIEVKRIAIEHRRKAVTGTFAVTTGKLAGKTVLLVDDDTRNIYALKSTLEEHKMLVVTAEHDFWYDAATTQKFIDATGAQHIHLPDAAHGFEIIDDLEQSRDAFLKTAIFLRDHLPVHRRPD